VKRRELRRRARVSDSGNQTQSLTVVGMSVSALVAIFGCLTAIVASVLVVGWLLSAQIGLMAAQVGAASGKAEEAEAFAHQAERESRLLEDQNRALTIRVEVAEALINAYGLGKAKEPKK
jgi:hypothetical protein